MKILLVIPFLVLIFLLSGPTQQGLPNVIGTNKTSDLELMVQAGKQIINFVNQGDSIAGVCADIIRAETDELAFEACTDFHVDYANTLRTFFLEHQNQTNVILYGQPISN
jgi:riboflavin synthase alpha subunit